MAGPQQAAWRPFHTHRELGAGEMGTSSSSILAWSSLCASRSLTRLSSRSLASSMDSGPRAPEARQCTGREMRGAPPSLAEGAATAAATTNPCDALLEFRRTCALEERLLLCYLGRGDDHRWFGF